MKQLLIATVAFTMLSTCCFAQGNDPPATTHEKQNHKTILKAPSPAITLQYVCVAEIPTIAVEAKVINAPCSDMTCSEKTWGYVSTPFCITEWGDNQTSIPAYSVRNRSWY